MLVDHCLGERSQVEDLERTSPSPSPIGEDAKVRPWVFHPLLIAVFPILSRYYHNIFELSPTVLVGPLAVALGATALLWLVLRIVSRDPSKTALATSLIVGLFFSYEVFDKMVQDGWVFLNDFWIPTGSPLDPLITVAMIGLMAIAGSWLIYRRSRRPSLWNSYLNKFAVILVILPVGGAIRSRMAEPENKPRHDVPLAVGPQARTPDVYFIVLDGYARSDVMKDLFAFDNRPFLERLERRGFRVAGQSTSNYCQTRLSLASTLNADYLDKLIDPRSRDLVSLGDRIKENSVEKQFRSRGYKFVSFATGFDATETPDADVYLTPGPSPSAFNKILIAMTPLAPIFAEVEDKDGYTTLRNRTLFQLERLPTVARMKEPTFTFAHILCPHPPFIFGENGEDVSPRRFHRGQKKPPLSDREFETPEYFRKGYRDQSAFITKQIDLAIDRILAESPEPPVIILQSDHGSGLHHHPDDVEATDLRERFGTLNAILIPGGKYEGFTDHSTSVNTFRIVMNNVFGANLPLLEERNNFSTFQDPLDFVDVTERLHSEKERKRIFHSPARFLGLRDHF